MQFVTASNIIRAELCLTRLLLSQTFENTRNFHTK